MSRLRDEPPSEEGSSADEGVPPKVLDGVCGVYFPGSLRRTNTRIPGSLADFIKEISGFNTVAFTLSLLRGVIEGLAHETRAWQSGFVSV